MSGRINLILTIILLFISSIHLLLYYVDLQNKEDDKIKLIHRYIVKVHNDLQANKNCLYKTIQATEKNIDIAGCYFKTEQLAELIFQSYKQLHNVSYGEYEYVIQNAYELHDFLKILQDSIIPFSVKKVQQFNAVSEFTIYDLYFLNNFLIWYMAGTFFDYMEEINPYTQIDLQYFLKKDICNTILIVDKFKYFLYEDQPIRECSHYLGLID